MFYSGQVKRTTHKFPRKCVHKVAYFFPCQVCQCVHSLLAFGHRARRDQRRFRRRRGLQRPVHITPILCYSCQKASLSSPSLVVVNALFHLVSSDAGTILPRRQQQHLQFRLEIWRFENSTKKDFFLEHRAEPPGHIK